MSCYLSCNQRSLAWKRYRPESSLREGTLIMGRQHPSLCNPSPSLKWNLQSFHLKQNPGSSYSAKHPKNSCSVGSPQNRGFILDSLAVQCHFSRTPIAGSFAMPPETRKEGSLQLGACRPDLACTPGHPRGDPSSQVQPLCMVLACSRHAILFCKHAPAGKIKTSFTSPLIPESFKEIKKSKNNRGTGGEVCTPGVHCQLGGETWLGHKALGTKSSWLGLLQAQPWHPLLSLQHPQDMHFPPTGVFWGPPSADLGCFWVWPRRRVFQTWPRGPRFPT